MSTISPGLYAQWRARSWAAHTLAERSDPWPLTERLLQLIWQHQRLCRDQLRTSAGQPVRVFHPGFWNHEAGPDFRGAIIQIGEALAENGDVEIDLSPQGWHGHRHDQNPAYKNVILHVVWESTPPAAPSLPTLPLKNCLDAPIPELELSLRNEQALAITTLLGRCSTALREFSGRAVGDLLQQAAEVRLQAKAGQLQSRARQVGWEQSLWEGLFGALGYKQNSWPMQRIAEVLPVAI